MTSSKSPLWTAELPPLPLVRMSISSRKITEENWPYQGNLQENGSCMKTENKFTWRHRELFTWNFLLTGSILNYTSNLTTQLSNTPSCYLSLWYILLQAQGLKIILKTPYRCFELILRSILMWLLNFLRKTQVADCNEHSCLTYSVQVSSEVLEVPSRKSCTQELSTSNYIATHWLALFKQVSTGFGKNACFL